MCCWLKASLSSAPPDVIRSGSPAPGSHPLPAQWLAEFPWARVLVGNSTTSLGNLFQCLTTLSVKNGHQGSGGVPIPGGVQKPCRCGTVGYGLAGVGVLGWWLDMMISEVFSNLNDSSFVFIYPSTAQNGGVVGSIIPFCVRKSSFIVFRNFSRLWPPASTSWTDAFQGDEALHTSQRCGQGEAYPIPWFAKVVCHKPPHQYLLLGFSITLVHVRGRPKFRFISIVGIGKGVFRTEHHILTTFIHLNHSKWVINRHFNTSGIQIVLTAVSNANYIKFLRVAVTGQQTRIGKTPGSGIELILAFLFFFFATQINFICNTWRLNLYHVCLLSTLPSRC